MTAARRLRWILLAAPLAFASLGVDSCSQYGLGSAFLFFQAPLFGQLSLSGDIDLELHLSRLADPASLEVKLDGAPLDPGALATVSGGVAGTLPAVAAGTHRLEARGELRFFGLSLPLYALTFFDTVDLERPDECDVLNDASCLLPYPSSRFLADVGGATATGVRFDFPVVGFEGLAGPPLDPAPFDFYDGYAPTAQVLMHFPQGVDLAASGAPVLIAPTPFDPQPTPYVGLRTQDGRSTEPDSPTVLLDADTGERILHWVELDAGAAGNPARQVLFLRPGKSLVPGHRYIVAVRNLVAPDGKAVRPEKTFRALRDGLPTTIASLEARRERFEGIFHTLWQAGVERYDLVLAFDFTVRSEDQLFAPMLTMRDDALGWLAGLAPDDVSGFSGLQVTEFGPCTDPAQRIWKRVRGNFAGPYYLTGNMDNPTSLTLLNVDADHLPVRNGTFPMAFDVAVPCAVYRGDAPGHPLLLGHGFLGRGSDMVSAYVAGSFVDETDVAYIAGATDWRGLSRGFTGPDALFLLVNVIGAPPPGGTGNKFNNFPALPARLQQGMVNTLVLSRMMKSGFLNRLPALQRVPGDPTTGVFPGPSEEMFYFGVSLGGIYGTFYAALNQDTIRHNVDVPGMNFALLEQRSTQFPAFLDLIKGIGLTDPMDLALLLTLQHELWVNAEPAAYVRRITGDVEPPLPDTPAKKLLVTAAFLDKQVSNQATEIMVRSLGIPNLAGSVQAQLEEIPDVDPGAAGVDSGYVIYDVGYFDIFDPAYDPYIPPLANTIPSSKCDPHGGARLSIPASAEQLGAFLRPGGRIFNFCDGACDAQSPQELPAASCDPLAP